MKNNNVEKSENRDILEKHSGKIDDLLDIAFLSPDSCFFSEKGGTFLSVENGGKTFSKVTIYRSFPFSEPEKYLSVREATPKAEEIGIIKNLDEWPEETRRLIRKQLEIRYFTPVISEIKDIKEEYGFAYWTVLTDKGEMKYTTSIWSPVTRITERRMLVSDLDGNRYEIQNFDKLTKKEKKLIDLFL